MEGKTSLTPQSITYSEIVDLSHVIESNIPIWPGDPPVEFEEIAEIKTDGYYLRKFSMGEHSGTHFNAPNSFDSTLTSIDCYSPQSLVVPAVVLDLRDRVAVNADYALRIADIEAWENQYGMIPPGCLVILFTGWQANWENSQAFFNADDLGQLHFPGCGAAAIQFLLEERQIAGLGIDTHGVEPGIDSSFCVNKLVLSKSGIILENLANLDRLPATGATLVIGILRLKGGSGSPVSVLAFIP
ncbi:MAG: cyclase family protein [Actinomycetota bacterium]